MTETPTVKQVAEYMADAHLSGFTAAEFHAYYDRAGWTVRGEPLRDWRAMCRRWSANRAQDAAPEQPAPLPFAAPEQPAPARMSREPWKDVRIGDTCPYCKRGQVEAIETWWSAHGVNNPKREFQGKGLIRCDSCATTWNREGRFVHFGMGRVPFGYNQTTGTPWEGVNL